MRRLFFVPEPSAGGDPACAAGLADRSLSGCPTGRGGQATSGPAGIRRPVGPDMDEGQPWSRGRSPAARTFAPAVAALWSSGWLTGVRNPHAGHDPGCIQLAVHVVRA